MAILSVPVRVKISYLFCTLPCQGVQNVNIPTVRLTFNFTEGRDFVLTMLLAHAERNPLPRINPR